MCVQLVSSAQFNKYLWSIYEHIPSLERQGRTRNSGEGYELWSQATGGEFSLHSSTYVLGEPRSPLGISVLLLVKWRKSHPSHRRSHKKV